MHTPRALLPFFALTLLAGISSAAPKPDTILAAREDPAVTFTAWSDTRQCNDGSSSTYTNADDGCYSLPGESISISSIADTCRTFIYGNGDCSGTEMQTYPGTCYDVRTFLSLKTFCH